MKFGDRRARLLITVGGIGTIVAVLLICVFLVQVVIPLFYSPELSEPKKVAVAEQKWMNFKPRDVQLLDNGSTGWTLRTERAIHFFRTSDGTLIDTLTSESSELHADSVLKVFPDGRCLFTDKDNSIRLCAVQHRSEKRLGCKSNSRKRHKKN